MLILIEHVKPNDSSMNAISLYTNSALLTLTLYSYLFNLLNKFRRISSTNDILRIVNNDDTVIIKIDKACGTIMQTPIALDDHTRAFKEKSQARHQTIY